MKKLIITILSIFIYFMATSCEYKKMTMPNSNDTSIIHSSGEIKYIQMNPVWNNFENPVDIYISPDDYIYVADSGLQQVKVLDKTGEPVISDESGNNFEALSDMNFRPSGICVDSKLNLFMTDKSNNIYVWNQFINNTKHDTENGKDSIAVSIQYRNINTNEIITVTDYLQTYILELNDYIIHKVNYEYDQTKIDSLKGICVFYTDKKHAESKFVSVGAAPLNKSAIYATDEGEQTILKIFIVRSAYIKLADGTTLWQHKGYRGKAIATAGTGAGTINDPQGMFVDPGGSIYYTQTGINFGFHKISEINVEQQLWASMFVLGQNEILDLDRFNKPYDVSVDEDANIFVLNTGANEVQVFDNGGQFIRKAGLRSVQMETTIKDTIDNQVVEKDTIVTKYYNDVLNNPRGIFVSEGVIYVLNSGDKTIVRFKLSSDLDVEIEE